MLITNVSTKDKTLSNLAFFVGVAIWATMFPSTEYLLSAWDPVTIAFVRLGIGGLILVCIFAAFEGLRINTSKLPWRKVFTLGILGVSGSTVLVTLGIKFSTSLTSALVATTGPILATLLLRLVYSEPLRKGIFVGITLAVMGGIFAVMGGNRQMNYTQGGEILIVFGILIWHWYSHNCQRWLADISQVGISALTVTAGALGLGIYIVAGALFKFHTIQIGTTQTEWLIVGWLSIGPACLSIFLWHFGVSRIGVTVGSMYQNLVPIVVGAIGITLGKYPNKLHLLGGILIISGVLYSQVRDAYNNEWFTNIVAKYIKDR
ncbi:MAG: hypothetical protein CL402_05890 [Acidiferrobacteraceae bacterium]|nr:hypothetical protein [Acidiferrobacteraceae bacterium]|tara:strand:- start:45420 stop:46376 length:957 start_codon:yes stop_codon:yes gene_type:complete